MEEHEKQKYWRKNITLIGCLLAVWFTVSLGAGILFVVPLNSIQLGGLPFGFWMAQQGAIFVFVILILIYARRMDKIDHEFHADE